jgi:tetrapyrrole methylase family protein/MazG family protein
MEVTICSLGGGNSETLTLGLLRRFKDAPRIVLQTGRVEAAEYLSTQGIAFETLDAQYDAAEDFEVLNKQAAQYLLDAEQDTVFACLGAPYENTAVLRLLKEAAKKKIRVSVLPGVSDVDAALCAALGKQDFAGVCHTAASGIAQFYPDTDCAVVVTQIDTPYKASAVKLRLADYFGDTQKITLMQGGIATSIKLFALDRQKSYDYSTALALLPQPLVKKERFAVNDLLRVMDRLRAPDGCPWDNEQTHVSLKQYLLEEAHEVLEAIDLDDAEKLYDELGDVMLQVAFHACIAKQSGEFDMNDIASAICRKMILRHPHIFGNVRADTANDVLVNWEAIKKKEKGLDTYTEVLTDIPKGMPALMRSCKVQKKAAGVGFDWDGPEGAAEKVMEETGELMRVYADKAPEERLKSEAGDLLFSAVNLCRKLHIEPETALTAATVKFIRRFEHMENAAISAGQSLKGMPLEKMDRLWEEAKKSGL